MSYLFLRLASRVKEINFWFAFRSKTLTSLRVLNSRPLDCCFNFSFYYIIMGPLQLTVKWYRIHQAGEQATHWDNNNNNNNNDFI